MSRPRNLREKMKSDMYTTAERDKQRIKDLSVCIEEMLVISGCSNYQGLLSVLLSLCHMASKTPGQGNAALVYGILTEMGDKVFNGPGPGRPPLEEIDS